jgi:hypothetical protein
MTQIPMKIEQFKLVTVKFSHENHKDKTTRKLAERRSCFIVPYDRTRQVSSISIAHGKLSSIVEDLEKV